MSEMREILVKTTAQVERTYKVIAKDAGHAEARVKTYLKDAEAFADGIVDIVEEVLTTAERLKAKPKAAAEPQPAPRPPDEPPAE